MIAHIAFWGLLIAGWILDELGAKSNAILVVLWLAGFWGLPYVPYGPALFASIVAVVDVVLVLLVFKRDIRLR